MMTGSRAIARAFWNRGYIEVEECEGNRASFYNFLFQDSQGNKLFVTTSGKESVEQNEFATITFTQVISEYNPSDRP